MPHPCLFVEHLTVMDVALLDAERGLLGQSWIVDLELEGPLNEAGMVLDFGEVKRLIKRRIDAVADHVLLVPLRAAALIRAGDTLHFDTPYGRITHRGPKEALCLLDVETITPEAARDFVESQLRALLDELDLPALHAHIALREEEIDGAAYQYAHGLKKHDGNCQRIAHGHRSRLHVWLDGVRAPQVEMQLADAWRDIYLGTREDVAERYSEKGRDYIRFAHLSGQGAFALTLPAARVALLETDSTVEWISAHLAATVKRLHPQAAVRVAAFEGVQKGAIAHA